MRANGSLEVLWCQLDVVLKVQLCLGIVLSWSEVDNEIILDGVDGVGEEVWVVLRENLGGNWLVVFVSDLQNVN